MAQISCKALLLDMDGVLVDSTPAVARVWTRWAAKYGMDPEYVTNFGHGRTSLSSIQELLSDASPAVHLEEANWMERAEIEDISDVTALPGARELLSAVPPGQLAVVTSATRELAAARLGAAGLWKLVANLVHAGDITRGKPDPEPYLKGAAVLQQAPQDCVVIEDAPSGARSGKAAGCRVLALRTTMPDKVMLAAGADWLIDDCAGLRCLRHTGPGLLLEMGSGLES